MFFLLQNISLNLPQSFIKVHFWSFESLFKMEIKARFVNEKRQLLVCMTGFIFLSEQKNVSRTCRHPAQLSLMWPTCQSPSVLCFCYIGLSFFWSQSFCSALPLGQSPHLWTRPLLWAEVSLCPLSEVLNPSLTDR